MKNADADFAYLVGTMALDVEGRLAKPYTPDGAFTRIIDKAITEDFLDLYMHLLKPYIAFQAEWSARCARNPRG